jgi:two-component system, response regulator FlrC
VAVMITGDSGVGKEEFFRLIHQRSSRAAHKAIAINCAAIPDNMLEAMLFGHEKGAFTGAYKSCAGKFEQAQGSTLLLDEISEMSLGLQAKLLRVLQERQVERLGSQQLIELDVRIIATSNRDLKAEVRAGNFREDLYYRLNVFPIHVPPLCERPGDIGPLARALLQRTARSTGRGAPAISDEAMARLIGYRWPGNVRELDNVMQRAAIIYGGAVVEAADLVFEGVAIDAANAPDDIEPDSLGDDLKDHERRLILDALEEGRGSRKFASEKLGISPRTLRYKIARMRDDGLAVPGR